MAKVECGDKCIKMDFIDVWCGHDEKAYCLAVDQTNGILQFNDETHISPLGSLVQAKAMRSKYDAFLKTKRNVEKG